MRRSLILLLGLAAAAALIGGAGGATAKADLSTRAGVIQYLKAHGIDTRGIVIQRGSRNYVGAHCPGAGWNCTRAARVVQIASGKNAVNRAQITSDTIKSCSGGSISQLSTDGSDNIVQVGLSGPSLSCSIVQQNTTGQNSVQLQEASQQSSGNNQSASQDALVTQYNLSGLNNFQLSQSVSQSISETVNPVGESQTSTQKYTAYQFNDTGTNNSQVTQSLSQSESDSRATSGTQYQSATLQGHVDQHSHGFSNSKNSQSEKQTQAAKPSGNVVQTQYGPMACCSIQEDNSSDVFRIDQSATQTQTPGKNGSTQQEQISGNCDTTGLCKVSQSYTQNGTTTTNSCEGSSCSVGIFDNGEGSPQPCSGESCPSSGGEFPGPASPPGPYCSDFTTSCAAPDLSIDKVADAASVDAGQAIGFTITVSNSSTATADATGVTLSDTLPGGTGVNWFIDSDSTDSCSVNGDPPNQTMSCAPQTIEPDTSMTVHVTSATTCSSIGTYNNTATYSSTNGGTGSDSDSESVVDMPGCHLT